MENVNEFLKEKGFVVNDLGQIGCVDKNNNEGKSFFFDIKGELYWSSCAMSRWLVPVDYFVVHMDQFACPLEDEIKTMHVLSGGQVDFFECRSGFVRANEHVFDIEKNLSMMIYFSAMFAWNISFVPDSSTFGRFLSIRDGVMQLCGDKQTVEIGVNAVCKSYECRRGKP